MNNGTVSVLPYFCPLRRNDHRCTTIEYKVIFIDDLYLNKQIVIRQIGAGNFQKGHPQKNSILEDLEYYSNISIRADLNRQLAGADLRELSLKYKYG